MDRFATLRDGLIGAWCPSLGAGSVLVDRSNYRSNGTLVGAPQYVAVQDGLALSFNGTSQRVDLTFPSITTNRLTIHGWGRYDALTTSYGALIYSRSGGMSVGAGVFQASSTSGQLTSLWNGTAGEYAAATNLTITAGAWFRWAMVVDGTRLVTWLGNSSFVNTITDTARNIGTTWSLAYDPFGPRWNPCAVDDVRVWSRALTGAELAVLGTRRRIGLTATNTIAAKFPTTLYQNVGGVWTPTTPQINVGGTWKAASPAINVGGVWKS